MKRDKLMSIFLNNYGDEMQQIEDEVIRGIFSHKNSTETYHSLLKLRSGEWIAMYTNPNCQNPFHIEKIELTDKGFTYFDCKARERRAFWCSLIGDAISAVIGAVLGWGLSYLTLG